MKKASENKKLYSETSNSTTVWLTMLSVISCIAVTFLHSNGAFWSGNVQTYEWAISNVIECFFYFGVGCFFMISGANLLGYNKRYSTKQYFKKRLLRTVVPYLIWSTIFICITIGTDPIIRNNLDFNFFWKSYILGGASPAYWFFPFLFFLYLIIPIFANIKEDYKDKIIFVTLCIGFVIAFLIPFVIKLANSNIIWPWAFTDLVYPLVYACAGYLIKKYNVNFWIELVLIVLCVGGFLTQTIGTHFLSTQQGTIVDLFKGYSNVPCFFYVIGVALIVKRCGSKLENHPYGVKTFSFIGKFTFTIYLSHYALLNALSILYYKWFGILTSSPIYILTSPLIILPIVILVVWLLRKVPYIKIPLKFILP